MSDFYLPAIRIRGYRPFRDVLFRFNMLEVIIGANGAGKSCFFEFLRFLRDSCYHEIPSEIISDGAGKNIFHKPGQDKLFWNAQIDFILKQHGPLFYQGEIEGSSGTPKVSFERIITKKSIDGSTPGGFTFLDFRDGKGLVRDPADGEFLRKEWDLGKRNQLGLGAITDASLVTLFNLREYMRAWRFYSGINFNIEKIRHPVPMEENSIPDEDFGNLSAVLYYLKTRHPEVFEDLKSLLRFAIHGCRDIDVKLLGDSKEVMTFWKEDGIDSEMSIADLSDGTIRFISFASLSLLPGLPPLIGIDDSEKGLHPRVLPVLAGLFEKASERTQVLLVTHDSYFMTQFDLENISVMKKTANGSALVSIRNSPTIFKKLKNIDAGGIEHMFRANEIENLF